MRLDTPVSELRGVGPRKAQALKRLGVETVSDLLEHYPTRVEFPPEPARIGTMDRVHATIVGVVERIASEGYGDRRFACTVLTSFGEHVSVQWFNAQYMRSRVYAGARDRKSVV